MPLTARLHRWSDLQRTVRAPTIRADETRTVQT